MKHIFLLLVTLIFSLVLAGCKTTTEPTNPVKYSIAGTVTSSVDGKTFPGVTVRLSYPDSTETTTNTFGTYRFDNVSSGNYFLYFTKPGFAPLSQNIHVDSNSTVNVTLGSALLDTAVIMIHVQDQNSLSIMGAKVNGMNDSLYTDASGNAIFKYNAISGSWPFKFSAANYISLSKFISFEHGQISYDTTTLVHQ